MGLLNAKSAKFFEIIENILRFARHFDKLSINFKLIKDFFTEYCHSEGISAV